MKMIANDSKHSNDTFSQVLRPDGFKIFALIIFPIIIILSIVANFIIIKLTLKFPILQGPISEYVIHKCVCNIIISSVPSLGYIIQTAVGRWPFGAFACNAVVVIEYAVLTTSICLMISKSVQQYFAVIKPFKKLDEKWGKFALIFAWLIGWPVAIPFVVINSRCIDLGNGKQRCNEFWVFTPLSVNRTPTFAYFIGIFVLMHLVPFMIMLALYSRIIHVILRKLKRPGVSRVEDKLRDKRRKLRIVKILLVILILFEVCWLPSFVQEFVMEMSDVKPSTRTSEIISFVTSFLGYAYGAINPFIYFSFMKKYRKTFLELFADFRCGIFSVKQSQQTEEEQDKICNDIALKQMSRR